MKKLVCLLFAVSLLAAAAACTAEPTVTPPPEPVEQQEVQPVPPADPVEDVPVVEPVPEIPAPEAPEGYLSLQAVLEGTDISWVYEDGIVRLTEDGLEVDLLPDSPFLYRRDFITGSLRKPVQIDGDFVYVPEDFHTEYLRNGQEAPSLYHSAQFFQDEIQAALEQPDTPQGQKLLNAIELPRSMGIETRHLDTLRMFSETDIGNNQLLMDELRSLGYDNPEELTYGEFTVIDSSRILTETLFPQMPEYQKFLDANPGIDPETCTVRDFTAWQKAHDREEAEKALTPEMQEFLTKYDIYLEDVFYLRKEFHDSYMNRSEDELRQVIESYYQLHIDFICP